jgi:adenosylcobinamide-GDP ribazoletransferase
MRRPPIEPAVRDFLRAVAFLTIVPVRGASPGGPGRAAAWFPLVGLLLGAALAAAQAGLARIFPAVLAAAMLVALWAILTGGLHLDGLSDSCDALAATVPPERRLEILRDPHRGAFGVAGLALFLILKTAALASLRPPAALALLLAPALARWAVLDLCGRTCARPGGLAFGFAAGAGRHPLLRAAPVPLALLGIALWFPGARALFAVAAAFLCARFFLIVARARLGGVTGDIFGLTIEVAELAVLIIYGASIGGPT